mgnify:CR=1 FL=1
MKWLGQVSQVLVHPNGNNLAAAFNCQMWVVEQMEECLRGVDASDLTRYAQLVLPFEKL